MPDPTTPHDPGHATATATVTNGLGGWPKIIANLTAAGATQDAAKSMHEAVLELKKIGADRIPVSPSPPPPKKDNP